MAGPGVVSFDTATAQSLSKLITAVDNDVDQHRSQVITYANNLESTWHPETPAKSQFYDDFNQYCAAMTTISDVGKRLITGLTNEIQAFNNTESVQGF